jgi:hypothetical protein
MVLSGQEKKIFILLSILSFTVFTLTNDGHRYSFDEDVTQQQSMWIATMTPDPRFVPGESQLLFQYPEYFPNNDRVICKIGILCSQVPIGSALTQVPFILLNQNFNVITQDTVEFTTEDFNDQHYVFWRNSLSPDFTFLELFYGPTFSALSVGLFFLISRTYSFSIKTSTILSLLFAFSTSVWAYSQTSLNIVPVTFFILLGFYFFRKFLLSASHTNLIFSGIALGFGFLVRPDTIIYIIPLFTFLIFNFIKNSNKIKNLNKIKNMISFSLPLILSYILYLQLIRLALMTLETPLGLPNASSISGAPGQTVLFNIFALLFSPGVGLLIFCPILFTIFLSYFDFFKKHKSECFLFISFIVGILFVYSNNISWHGLNAWTARYLITLIPFLLIPLGFSIENRGSKKFYSILIGLGFLGLIYNISYIATDVSWFIWGLMGSGKGLYELGHVTQNLWVHPLVIWTFEYSQLTHAIRYLFLYFETNSYFKPDIYLLKVWGLYLYSIFFILPIGTLIYFIIKFNKKPKTVKI